MASNVADAVQNLNLDENKEKLKAKKKAATAAASAGKKVALLNPPPQFIADREQLWNKLKAERDVWLSQQVPQPIKITLPDGKEVPAESWRTTPYDVALGISKGLADNCVVAKVNGDLWDLDRPLEQDANLELVKFDDEEGQAVFWHSSAHVLGEAMERVYGGHLCYGPPIEQGFYYDMHHEGLGVSQADYPGIEEVMKKITKEKQPFERLEMSKA